jgi:hypothetical protein
MRKMLSLQRIALKSFRSGYSFKISSRSFQLLAARPPQRGTGFDNFLNKDDHDREKNSKGESDGGSEGSNKNGGGNNGNGLLWFVTAVAILGATNYMTSRSSDEEAARTVAGGSGASGSTDAAHHARGEISWGEFLRLLQQQDIVKILVDGNSERPIARVYIRENAVGLRRRRSTIEHDSLDEMVLSSSSTNGISMSEESGMIRSSSSRDSSSTSSLHVTPLFYRLPIGSIDSFERKLEDAQRALDRDPSKDVPVQYMADSTLGREALSIIPGLFLAGLLYTMLRFSAGGGMGIPGRGGGGGGMGGIFQIGKSTHKKVNKEDVTVRFSDVAGCEEAKKEIMEFVDFLKDADRFTKLGAKIPKGALLCGPPGTGKTLLAKAVAGEAGVPFFSISGKLSPFVARLHEHSFLNSDALQAQTSSKCLSVWAPRVFVTCSVKPGRMRLASFLLTRLMLLGDSEVEEGWAVMTNERTH